MSTDNSSIRVGRQGDTVSVRLQGRGTHTNSHLLKAYLLQCLSEKRDLFQIDLSQCNYMDSTFLGMLAGLGIKFQQKSLERIKLLKVTDRVRGMIEGLGIDCMFDFSNEEPMDVPMEELQGAKLDKDEKTQQMLDAHEKLVEISPQNETKFKDVITLLKKESEDNK